MSEKKELYDSKEEIERNNKLENLFCSEEEWKIHPDNRFSYEQLFCRFENINFPMLSSFEIRQEFMISCHKSIYHIRLINDFISNGFIRQLELAYDAMYTERNTPDYHHDLLYATKNSKMSMIETILDLYLNKYRHHIQDIKYDDFVKNLKLNKKLQKEEKELINKKVLSHVEDGIIQSD